MSELLAVRRLRQEIVLLRVLAWEFIAVGVLLLWWVDGPLVGVMVLLGGSLVFAAVTSRKRRLAALTARAPRPGDTE